MTPTESRSPTECPVVTTEDTSRELVDFLLDNGDQAALVDAMAIDTDLEDIDDVTGWGCSVCLPRPPLYEARRSVGTLRKRTVKQNLPDMDLTNMRIRCVSEDYIGDHQNNLWKANVEPGTYRYISNNGIYRSTKFASIGSDWVTAKRARHTDNNTTTKPEVRQAQRSLIKDLDNHFKSADNEDYKNQSFALHKTPNDLRQEPGTKTPLAAVTADVENKLSSENQLQNNKDPKLIKSTSDLFVENFSTRMSALEKSEKETNNPETNNRVGIRSPRTRTPCSPQKSSLSSATTQKTHKRYHDHTSDTKLLGGDDISKDVFTVRPVTRAPEPPLRPLEKLTPQQKLIERAGGSECSSHQSKSGSESPALQTSFMTAMNVFAQVNHRPIDTNSRSNPSTHRTNSKSRSMSNVSDSDSLNSVRHALTLTNNNIERMRLGSYGKHPVKDYGRFLSTRPKPIPHSTVSFNRSCHGMNMAAGSVISGSGLGKNNKINSRKAMVGYKSLSTSAPVSFGSTVRPSPFAAHGTNAPGTNVPSMLTTTLTVDDGVCGLSETSESYLSGTSLSVNRGSGSLRDGKGGPGGMALPEISGKRLAVTTTTQRML